MYYYYYYYYSSILRYKHKPNIFIADTINIGFRLNVFLTHFIKVDVKLKFMSEIVLFIMLNLRFVETLFT